MLRKILPDFLAIAGLLAAGYGLYQINTNIAYIVIGGVLFVLGLYGSLK